MASDQCRRRDVGVRRRLRRPVERGRHFERQLFAAGKVDRRVLDLASNGRQVPRQLVVGHRALERHAIGRDDEPRSVTTAMSQPHRLN